MCFRLGLLALLIEAVYLVIAVRLPLLRYGESLRGWRSILAGSGGPSATAKEAWVFGAFLLAIALLLAAYATSRRLSEHQEADEKIVWAGAIAFSITLVWLLPITCDVFVYVGQAHQFTDLGANPLLTPLEEFAGDTLLQQYPTVYSHTPSSYGPAWVLLSSIGTLFDVDVMISVLYIKVLALAAYLLTIWLLSRILRQVRPRSSLPGAVLFAWNPLVLLMAVGDGHNDMVMMAFVLLAFWLLLRRRWALSFGALTFSIWIKYASAVFLPLFLLYAMQAESAAGSSAGSQSADDLHQPVKRRARRQWAAPRRGILGAIAASAVVLVPFQGLRWFPGVLERFFRPANAVGAVMDWSIPLLAIGTGLFVAACIVLAWRYHGGEKSFLRLTSTAFWLSILAFTLFAVRTQPWHLIWPATLAPLSGVRWAMPLIAGLSGLMLLALLWVEWGAPGLVLAS